MGESAGAASIMHHLTAFGRMGKAPFGQAIIQSPAFAPYTGQDIQDENFELILKWASILNDSEVTTLHQLRNVLFDVLLKVNQLSTTPRHSGNNDLGSGCRWSICVKASWADVETRSF